MRNSPAAALTVTLQAPLFNLQVHPAGTPAAGIWYSADAVNA
jgi:hypothetical protein